MQASLALFHRIDEFEVLIGVPLSGASVKPARRDTGPEGDSRMGARRLDLAAYSSFST
jgi:hypothetical protein